MLLRNCILGPTEFHSQDPRPVGLAETVAHMQYVAFPRPESSRWCWADTLNLGNWTLRDL